jgi:hypothetical protein
MTRSSRGTRALRSPAILGVAIALSLFVHARGATASLGGDESSIEADAAQAKGDRSIKTGKEYAIHEIVARSGVVIREYLSPAGTVFAVAWRGPWLPNLRQILGTYFDQFSRAAKARHARRGPLVIDEPGLFVRSGGHMRSFFGEAHVPALLPDGVGVEELR